jgi:hypothetical protein
MRLRKDLFVNAASWLYIRSGCPSCGRSELRTCSIDGHRPSMEHECLVCRFWFTTMWADDDGRRKVVVIE